MPEQCRFCPGCERALDSGPEGAWQDRLWEGLRGEYSEAGPRLRAVAVLGGLYVCVLTGAGVGYLVEIIEPGAGASVGFLLFCVLLVLLLVLILHELQREPNQPSLLPPKARRGIFLVLVLAGFVCTLLLVSVVAFCGFFFTACTCTGGRVFQ